MEPKLGLDRKDLERTQTHFFCYKGEVSPDVLEIGSDTDIFMKASGDVITARVLQ
jgi:hypothetical protein